MKKYHKMFTKINTKTIKTVREMIENGFFRENERQRCERIKELNVVLCKTYNIPVISVVINGNITSTVTGFYDRIGCRIVINKPSLVTYLHEFKHYLIDKQGKVQSEIKARGWSHSVFYLASPKHFKRALRKGLLIWQNEEGNKR